MKCTIDTYNTILQKESSDDDIQILSTVSASALISFGTQCFRRITWDLG